jgi:hypothetical protein
MAFKVIVDTNNLRVVIDTDSLSPVTTFQNFKSVVTFTQLEGLLQYVDLTAANVFVDADTKNLYFTSYSFSIVKEHPFIRFIKINKITGAATLIITTGLTKETHLPGYDSPPASFDNKQTEEGGRINWQQVEQDILKRKWEENLNS